MAVYRDVATQDVFGVFCTTKLASVQSSVRKQTYSSRTFRTDIGVDIPRPLGRGDDMIRRLSPGLLPKDTAAIRIRALLHWVDGLDYYIHQLKQHWATFLFI